MKRTLQRWTWLGCLLLIVAGAWPAHAFYNSTTGRWISRDPLEDEAFNVIVVGNSELLQDALGDDDHLGGNPYLFVWNNPINRIDLFGLWSPGAHDALVDHALKDKLKSQYLKIIQQSSRDFDKRTQGADDSPKHSMRKKGQAASDATTARDKFINDTIEKAKKAADAGKCEEALKLLGEALHPVMDSSSPMHTDSTGNPKEWDPWHPWGHSPNDSIGKERKQDLTDAIYKSQDDLIRGYYDKVFKNCPCKPKIELESK